MSLQDQGCNISTAALNRKKVSGKTRTNSQSKKPKAVDKHNLILWFNTAKQKFCYSSPEDPPSLIYRNRAQKVQALPIRAGEQRHEAMW